MLVHQTTNTQGSLQTQCDFGLHIGQFLLEKLCLCQRAIELLAVETVLSGTVPAIFSRTKHTP